MFKLKFYPLICIRGIPDKKNLKKILHKTDCFNLLLINSTERHLAAISGTAGGCRRPVDWVSDSWRNSLLLIIPICLCIFLLKKWIFFIIFDCNYFKAGQTAFFYK